MQYDEALKNAITALSRLMSSLDNYKKLPTTNKKHIEIQEQNIKDFYSFIAASQDLFDSQIAAIIEENTQLKNTTNTMYKDAVFWQQMYVGVAKSESFFIEKIENIITNKLKQ